MPARLLNPEDLARGLNKNVQSLLAVKGRGISVQGSKGLDLSSVRGQAYDSGLGSIRLRRARRRLGRSPERQAPPYGSYGLRPAQNEEEACMTFLLECGRDKACPFRRLRLQLDLKGQHGLSRPLGETGFLTANRIFHDRHVVRPLPRPS